MKRAITTQYLLDEGWDYIRTINKIIEIWRNATQVIFVDTDEQRIVNREPREFKQLFSQNTGSLAVGERQHK